MKVMTITETFRFKESRPVRTEMSTLDFDQGMRRLAELTHAMSEQLRDPRYDTDYDVSVVVKRYDGESNREKWFDCSINGDPCSPEKVINHNGRFPSGDDAPSCREWPQEYVAAVACYKIGGRLFESWHDVLSEYPTPSI